MVYRKLGGIAMKVTREDLEGLRETIQLNIHAIEEYRTEDALWSLGKLLSSINRTLGEDKLNG